MFIDYFYTDAPFHTSIPIQVYYILYKENKINTIGKKRKFQKKIKLNLLPRNFLDYLKSKEVKALYLKQKQQQKKEHETIINYY